MTYCVSLTMPVASRSIFLAAISSSMPRRIAFLIVSGVMPCSSLYSSCSSRRRCVSSMRPLHAVGDRVGVQNHLGVDVAGGAADRLDQARLAAQKAFLVGVENRDQRDFRQVEPFAQQVHADDRVELPFAQLAENFHPLDGVELRVQPLAADPFFLEVVDEIFGQPLGQRGDQHALAAFGPFANLLDADAAPGRGPGAT